MDIEKVTETLSQMEKVHETSVDAYVATLRDKYLVPFCDKHNLRFHEDDGWASYCFAHIATGTELGFHKGSLCLPGTADPIIVSDETAELHTLMTTRVPLIGFTIGELMKSYDPTGENL